MSLTNSQAVSICAAGLLVCFFLPWTRFLGYTVSGFDLQKLGDGQKALWLIPVFSAITIFGGMTKRSQKNAARITGALPFIVLIYWYQKFGQDVFRILSFGAYLLLFFGLMLWILPQRQQ